MIEVHEYENEIPDLKNKMGLFKLEASFGIIAYVQLLLSLERLSLVATSHI